MIGAPTENKNMLIRLLLVVLYLVSVAVQAEPLADGTQTAGSGVVTRILADDNNGSRHQRFILTLDSGQTVLVAHNIDVAPRIDGLRVGDTVSFYGEYVWNEKGGVIHWTHHDPAGKHKTGWVRHNGERYQ